MRLIDADALYAKLQEHEELARKRVWDTASTLPFPNNLNPAYTRYLAQLDERTALKHMVADAPTIEQPEIIRCKDCKHGVDYYHEGNCYCSNPKWGLQYFGGSWEFYCADAERRTDG